MKRIAIYIDGSNFYFSVKKKFNCKIDIEKFCKKLTSENNLVKINYYISPVEQFSNPEMFISQQKFLEKLKKINNLKIIFGRLERRKQNGNIYYVRKVTYVAIGNTRMISYHLKKVATRTLRIESSFIEDIKL